MRITLTPSVSYSMQVGSTLLFTASATNSANTAITPAFTYSSSNPGVVDVTPNGVACAGTWNAPQYSICTPAQAGTAVVTASALGATSAPTLIFVHPPIANVTVTIVPPVNSTPPACPSQALLPVACDLPPVSFPSSAANGYRGCLSQNQIETLQATALDDNGNDITGAVGPFTWSEVNPAATKITPIISVTTNSPAVPTNEATAGPAVPGQTQIVASASGVSSQPFFFETCPVQCIAMELNLNGEQVSNETNFVTTKGSTESITAIAVDVQGCIVPKPPLTWVSSSPAAISAGGTTGCAAGTACTISTAQAGAAAITASCSPPTCNIGWPLNFEGLPAGSVLIPEPVYPVTAISGLVTPGSASSTGTGSSGSGSGSSGSGSGSSGSGSGSSGSGSGSASSGSGSSGSGSSGSGSSGSGSSSSATASTSVLVSSQDCYSDALCNVALYNVPTTTNIPGSATPIPTPPNSLMFDPAGDRAYIGSQYGALTLNPASIGTSSSAFTALTIPRTQLGVITGRVIGVSQNGGMAVFSDTVSTPNQVYVASVTSTTSSSSSSSSSTTTTTTSSNVALNINNATTATFSPDGLKAFILADGGNSLYVYSTLQNLLAPIPLPAPATSIVFNSSGTFAILSGGIAPTTYPGTFAIYNTCDNSAVTLTPPAVPTSLPSPPLFLKMVPAGNVSTGNALIPALNATGLDFFFGIDDTGIDIIATNASQGPVGAPFSTLCPQTVTLAQVAPVGTTPTYFQPIHINIGQGTFTPINFFISPDSTLAYIVASDRNSILVYNFTTRSTSAIALANNASPLSASMSADGSLIYVAGSDGLLHALNTYAAFDEYQISFPPLVNSTNSFCYTGNNCQMDLLSVKP
ncbi:MAG: hypothetical protein WBD59_20660 [Candidatus Sulfotelmatobacter sp.]